MNMSFFISDMCLEYADINKSPTFSQRSRATFTRPSMLCDPTSVIDIIYQILLISDLEIDLFAIACQIEYVLVLSLSILEVA